MQRLDRQIAKFESDLVAGVGITIEESRKVATHVATDVRFLPKAAKDEISLASWVPLQSRFKELVAFQRWSDFCCGTARQTGNYPRCSDCADVRLLCVS